MRHIILSFLFGFCPILSQAQTTQPVAIPSFPSLNSTTSTNTTTTPAATTPTNPYTGLPLYPTNGTDTPATPKSTIQGAAIPAPVANVNGPKYTEYQSFCRTHDYDQVQYLSDSLKEKRLHLLQDKMKAEPDSVKIKVRLLKEFVDQKKFKDAEELLKQIRLLKDAATEIQMAEAIYSFGKSENKSARDRLTKILDEQPKNTEVLKLLAEVYRAEGNFYEYTTIFYDLLKLSRESYDEQLCEALTLDGHYTEAEKFCNKGALENKNPNFSIYLGIAAREKDNYKEAQRLFSTSLKIKETEMGLVCSGEISMLQKEFKAAEEAFQKALQLSPKSYRAQTALAWTYFNNKERTKALAAFTTACSLNKKAIADIRQALKLLIQEKSEMVKQYGAQSERCLVL